MTASVQWLDPRAARFSQGLLALVIAAGLVIGSNALVPFAALALGFAVLFGPRANPLALPFRYVIRPLLRLGKPSTQKLAAPTQFASVLGFVFLAWSSVFLYLAPAAWATFVGWTLALVVAALAALSAATGLCVGCEIFSLLTRLSTPGGTPSWSDQGHASEGEPA